MMVSPKTLDCSRPPQRRHPSRRGGLPRILILCLFVGSLIAGGIYWRFQPGGDRVASSELITDVAARGPFDHIVLEQGEIESSSNVDVICQVRAREGTPILWVIDEGARVKKGDKLVELDRSDLEMRLKEQTIEVITAESELANAKAMLQQAKIARQEYLEGVFKTEESALLSEMAIAKQERKRAELGLQSSQRLVAKGLIKSLQLQADQYALANADTKVESLEAQLSVLRELTKEKMLVQFDSDITSAEAKLSAAEAELVEETGELEEIETQLARCMIYAPSDGVVVHANRYSRRGGSSEFVVEAGASVREKQSIIKLPDPTKMQVNCKVNESRITLIEPGMPAIITVDALPELKMRGRVTKVNRYAEPGSWYSSSIKEYATFIEIIDPPETIRTGMTAEVQIFVEQLDDALQIPIQGLYEYSGQMFTLIKKGDDSFETREVKLSATNDTMASISEGINDDETVVLNLRQHMSLMELPEIEREDNSNLSDSVAQDVADGDDEKLAARGPDGDSQDVATASQTGGPPAGGGRPDASEIVRRSMEQNDADGDGKLSSSEIAAIDSRWRESVSSADTDGDGDVSRSELLQSIKKRLSGRSRAGGAG